MTHEQHVKLEQDYLVLCKRWDRLDERRDRAEAEGDEEKVRRLELKLEYLDGKIDGFRQALSILGIDLGLADDGTRIKGLDARMEIWKKTGDSAVQMLNLDEAREGDEIQLRYSVPEKCFGLLFSMDGNGTVTMHMADGSQAVALEPGKMTTLPFAYKLDNAPKFEKFFLLTSQKDFAIDASNIDALFKNKDIRNVSITLRKVGGK